MTASFPHDHEGFTKATTEANRLNKIIVCDALAKAGITRVFVGFEGEGDEGQMDRVAARSNDKVTEFPEVTLSLWVADFGCTELRAHELDLQEAVKHLCFGYLEDRHGGWEIDEGSFGEFTFDVPARTISLDLYERRIDYIYFAL
jgi:hypothetical protein